MARYSSSAVWFPKSSSVLQVSPESGSVQRPVFQLPKAKAQSFEATIYVRSGSERLAPFPFHLYCFRQDTERTGFMFISNSYWAPWARHHPGHWDVAENRTSENPHPLGADIPGHMFTWCLYLESASVQGSCVIYPAVVSVWFLYFISAHHRYRKAETCST